MPEFLARVTRLESFIFAARIRIRPGQSRIFRCIEGFIYKLTKESSFGSYILLSESKMISERSPDFLFHKVMRIWVHFNFVVRLQIFILDTAQISFNSFVDKLVHRVIVTAAAVLWIRTQIIFCRYDHGLDPDFDLLRDLIYII